MKSLFAVIAALLLGIGRRNFLLPRCLHLDVEGTSPSRLKLACDGELRACPYSDQACTGDSQFGPIGVPSSGDFDQLASSDNPPGRCTSR